MLVTCKNCGISFADSLRKCVGCGEDFVPAPTEARGLAVEAAVRMLQSKVRKPDVLVRLVNEFGMGDLDAESVLSEATAFLRTRSKAHGRSIAWSGFGLLAIALLVHVMLGGLVIAKGCIALGSGMVLLGALKAWTGWNLTGNDDDDTAEGYGDGN